MTKRETAQLLAIIASAYPASKIAADEMTLGLWHEMLADIPGEVAAAATKRMIATLKFPPSIADIREAVAKATQDAQGKLSAGEAWAKVKSAISLYGSYRTEAAKEYLGADVWRAVEYIGGWVDLCISEDPETVKSAQFERRYNAMIDQQAQLVQIPTSVRNDMARLVGPMAEKMLIGGGTDG